MRRQHLDSFLVIFYGFCGRLFAAVSIIIMQVLQQNYALLTESKGPPFRVITKEINELFL